MTTALNDIERRILDFMVAYLRSNTYQPSIREIGERFGIKSTKTVSEHLQALAEKGFLERDPSRSRGVRILGMDLNPDAVSLPCYRDLPDARGLRPDRAESFLTLDRKLVPNQGAFVVRAKGEGLAVLGVTEGDYLLVEPTSLDQVEDGAVLVVRDGEGSVFRPADPQRTRRLPARPADRSRSAYDRRSRAAGAGRAREGAHPSHGRTQPERQPDGPLTSAPNPPPAAPAGDPGPQLFPWDSSPPETDDLLWMARALEQARVSRVAGEVPVGAVIVRRGALVAEAHNLTLTVSDPTAHAEIVALRRAALRLGDWRLLETTLYVTLEPCAMCAGAMVLGRVLRVVYGAADPKAGMAGSLGNLLQDPRLNHRCVVTAGVGADSAAALLKTFFRERRR